MIGEFFKQTIKDLY